MAAIGGTLNFTPGGNPLAGAGGGLPGLALDYGNAYNSALQSNQQNYNNILAGYQQNMNQLQQGQTNVGQGYGSLMSGIQNTLGANYGVPGVNNQWGIAAPAASAINKLYSAQTGQAFDAQGNPVGRPTGGSIANSLVSRGLGNTTVMDSLNRGATSDYGNAIGSLGANLAQTYAGYQANIGESYLGQQNQENLSLANQGNQQLNWMNSVQIPYPNASLYASIYQQQGQAAQAAAAQAQQLQIFKTGLGRGGPSTGGVSVGAAPRGGTYGSGGGGFPSGGGVSPIGSGNIDPNGPNSIAGGGGGGGPPVGNTYSGSPGGGFSSSGLYGGGSYGNPYNPGDTSGIDPNFNYGGFAAPAPSAQRTPQAGDWGWANVDAGIA